MATAEKSKQPGVKRWVFWPAAVIVTVFVGFALLAPNAAEALFGAIQSNIVNTFNWYYVLIAAFFVAFCLFLGFSRFGDIRLGKDDEEPEFSLMSWFSLLFAAGMGIGLVFYGVSEPLSHFATPRPGVEGTPPELAQLALTQTYLHWGVHAWSIYVVVGLALAYAIHRRNRPISIRWALEPLLGKKVRGAWGNAVDVIALVGTLFGVATSLGLGVLQIGAGLDAAGFGKPTELLQVVIILVISCFVLFSVLSGVEKGMKWLSNTNLVLAGLLVIYLLVTGPTTFLLREFVQSIGGYIQNFVSLSFNVNAFTGDAGESWQASWTSFYWGWWISWAPFVGIFIARVSRGRTVRQFVTGVILVPTLIGVLWFSVLGGTAIAMELANPGTLVGANGAVNLEGALFTMLAQIPGGQVITYGVILLIGLFFITSADSGALVMGMLATGGQIHPARWIRIFFTAITALLAIALLLTGGLKALQTAAIIIALPFSVVMLMICWSTVLAFSRERRAYVLARRAQLVDNIGDFYGLDPEEAADDVATSGPTFWTWPLRKRAQGRPGDPLPPEQVLITTAESLPDPEPSTAAIDILVEVEQLAQAGESLEDAAIDAQDLPVGGIDEFGVHDPKHRDTAQYDTQTPPDGGEQPGEGGPREPQP
ncbi:BCCT family transporter [Microterricola viridarii]|uniref:Choline/glycine/proline betaine transport protein n=1 Tax=Microterricola viridarii TaxID=412690 RepID=A0A1H1PKX7_9MICO|nr:BCCT family transporter [Microterricola viridarii]SDS11750.1 choline/glycine/proline betaine transport protein [Microterricola viridarii]